MSSEQASPELDCRECGGSGDNHFGEGDCPCCGGSGKEIDKEVAAAIYEMRRDLHRNLVLKFNELVKERRQQSVVLAEAQREIKKLIDLATRDKHGFCFYCRYLTCVTECPREQLIAAVRQLAE